MVFNELLTPIGKLLAVRVVYKKVVYGKVRHRGNKVRSEEYRNLAEFNPTSREPERELKTSCLLNDND